MKDGLLNYLDDNQNAWEMQSNGQWEKVAVEAGAEPHNAQKYLIAQKISTV